MVNGIIIGAILKTWPQMKKPLKKVKNKEEREVIFVFEKNGFIINLIYHLLIKIDHSNIKQKN